MGGPYEGLASPARRFPLGARAGTLALIAMVGVIAARYLGLDLAGLWPREAGMAMASDLMGAALSPAFAYETDVPPGTPAFGWKILGALARTVLFAAGAMSMALPIGLALGILASDRFWELRRRSGGSRAVRSIQAPIRVLIALMRSLHELLWAVLFLAALGLNSAAAVISIAIPIDETPVKAPHALQDAGAGRLTALLVGVLPAAMPDLLSYSFYRFECAIRSAAVLGFFGYPTIGLYVAQSFENYQLHEVWTYLYALIALVVAVEAWSRGVRRRIS